MATENTRQQPSGVGTVFWALFWFLLFVVLVLGLVRRSVPKQGYEDRRAAERLEIKEKAVSEAQQKLSSSGIVDPAKGIAHVSIDEAKSLVIKDLKAKQITASQVKVDPWLPVPPPYDPNAAEPPPPALTSAPQGADTIRFEAAQPAAK